MLPPVPVAGRRAFVVPASIALLCLVWGSTWWAIREALLDQPPLTSAALRFLLAGAAMAAVTPLLRRVDHAPPPPRWLWLTTGATSFAGAYGVLYVAEQTVPSGVAAVLWAVFPLLMATSGVLFLGERLRPLQRLGFVVSLAGVVVVFARGLGGAKPAAAALLLCSPVLSATGTTLVKRHGAGTSSVLLNRNGMLAGAVLLAAAGLWREGLAMAWSWRGVLATLYLALFGTALTFGVYFWLLQRVPASRLALISYVTPVLAVALAALVGDGELGVPLVLGTLLVTAGIALVVQRGTGWRPAWPRSRCGRRTAAAALAALVLGALWVSRGDDGRRTWPREQILAAIRRVESGNRDDVPDGDGGRAIGPYQIHRVYWLDAVTAEPALGGDYQDCRRREYAERVVAAYMRKWVPGAWQAGDAQTIARVHNGGPDGAAKDATLPYWRRVRAALP